MKDYHSTHMVKYERPASIGWTCVETLPFLIGRKWNQLALNYVHSLRPSSIRVTTGVVKLDAQSWRVTVYVDDNDIIEKIEQEVEVGSVGYNNAYEMRLELESS